MDMKGSRLEKEIPGAVWSDPVGGRSLVHFGARLKRGWLAKARSNTEGRFAWLGGKYVYSPGVLIREYPVREA